MEVKFFKLMEMEVPVVFNAGAISKWLRQIGKSDADIAASIANMTDHETAWLIYTGIEYGYGISGMGRCPFSFYEVENYLLEDMKDNDRMNFDDLMLYAVECVAGRADRMAKKNGIDLDMTSVAKKMRENWEALRQAQDEEMKEDPGRKPQAASTKQKKPTAKKKTK